MTCLHSIDIATNSDCIWGLEKEEAQIRSIKKGARCSSSLPKIGPVFEIMKRSRSCHTIDLGQVDIDLVTLSRTDDISEGSNSSRDVLQISDQEKEPVLSSQSRMYPSCIIGKGRLPHWIMYFELLL